MKKLGLVEVLEGIEDTRCERSVWYPLHEVLFIFAAVICCATSYVKVEMFGKSKEKRLKKYINLEIWNTGCQAIHLARPYTDPAIPGLSASKIDFRDTGKILRNLSQNVPIPPPRNR